MKTAIVIGGGIAGCSTAYALAKHGVAVTLIEQHEKLANEASGNPIAVLYPKISTKPDAASLLTLQGFEFTLDLLKTLPNHVDFFNACGLIQLAFNARETARQLALGENKFAKLVNAESASEIAGISLKTGGLFLPRAGFVRPEALCHALCSHARIKRVLLKHVLNIQKQANIWQVFDAESNVFEADFVVICNANDITQFTQVASAKITPVRGQINFFEQNELSQNINTIICSDHFVSPADAGWHAIGTSYAANDLNPNASEKDTRASLNALGKISPEIAHNIDINSVKSRVAWRSQSLDYLPLAGQLLDEEMLRKNPPRYNANPSDLPWLQGLFVNAGHGSKGMITAPICGEIIASIATDNALPIAPALSSSLNPSRFLLRELGLKQLAASLHKNLLYK